LGKAKRAQQRACPHWPAKRPAFPRDFNSEGRKPACSGSIILRPFAGLFDATLEEMAEIWQALRQAVDDLTREHQPGRFNVGVNVGEAAGQTVMHLHVHLIPRYAGDQPDPRGGIRLIFRELADYWTPRGQ
jgi:diadenosine tetraphosphate (Ap4A) HIT family hydrolase